MRKEQQLFSPSFTGPISTHLEGFLNEKRSLGFRYQSEAWRLGEIDRLTITMNTPPDSLPRSLMEAWYKRTSAESHKTWMSRKTVMNQLADYFFVRDLDVFKPSFHSNAIDVEAPFVPHIFTTKELRSIFTAADKLQPVSNSPLRGDVASLLFRVLYACGLRLSEALSLTMECVDLENGVITIYDGKNKTDRYAPLSSELTERCKAYVQKCRTPAIDGCPFFPAPDGGFYSKGAVSYMWYQILRAAKIPKTDDGPRIHDFRHTFAVSCLRKWVREKKDLNAMLPVLSSYLGHRNFGATQRYLRLTAEVYPDVTALVEAQFGGIIPRGNGVDDED